MNKKSKQWCAVSRCMNSSIQEKRHFFRFPKEHDRWLQWIKASNRLDLEPKGPNYAYNNCTLCHLHFEEKWFIKKSKLRLHPDAVPTIFFGNIQAETEVEAEAMQEREENIQQEEICRNIEIEPALTQEENEKSHMASSKLSPTDINAETQPSTSSNVHPAIKISSKNSREKKLESRVLKLKKQNKKLQQTVRRLKKKLMQQKRTLAEEESDVIIVRKLGR